MRDQLKARLRGNAGVAAVAGVIPSGNTTRPAVDWLERKSDAKSAFPALVLKTASGQNNYDQDGASGLRTRRVRTECYGLTYEQARALAEATITALEPAETVGGMRFHRAKLVLDLDFEPEDLGGGMKVFRTLLDFMISTTPA